METATVLLVQHDSSLTNTKIRGFYFYVHVGCVCVSVYEVDEWKEPVGVEKRSRVN